MRARWSIWFARWPRTRARRGPIAGPDRRIPSPAPPGQGAAGGEKDADLARPEAVARLFRSGGRLDPVRSGFRSSLWLGRLRGLHRRRNHGRRRGSSCPCTGAFGSVVGGAQLAHMFFLSRREVATRDRASAVVVTLRCLGHAPRRRTSLNRRARGRAHVVTRT